MNYSDRLTLALIILIPMQLHIVTPLIYLLYFFTVILPARNVEKKIHLQYFRK